MFSLEFETLDTGSKEECSTFGTFAVVVNGHCLTAGISTRLGKTRMQHVSGAWKLCSAATPTRWKRRRSHAASPKVIE